MRSGTGTKSGEPGFVTFATKAMMDCFAGPSFHEGKGSAACEAAVVKASAAMSAAAIRAGLSAVLLHASEHVHLKPYCRALRTAGALREVA